MISKYTKTKISWYLYLLPNKLREKIVINRLIKSMVKTMKAQGYKCVEIKENMTEKQLTFQLKNQ